MRHLIVVFVAVVFATAAFVLKKHREKFFILGVAVLCLISGAYCYTKAEGVLATRHPYNQTFYTPDYIETQEFPDAFLRLYLKDKTVYVKDDAVGTGEAQGMGYYWMYGICHYNNMVHFLEEIDSKVTADKNMNDVVVPDDKKRDFESLGYINDMLRNTMMYSGIDSEIGNYLYYVWYYRDFTNPAKLYVNTEDLEDADELVLIWQPQIDATCKETEDMYLMSKDYYDAIYK